MCERDFSKDTFLEEVNGKTRSPYTMRFSKEFDYYWDEKLVSIDELMDIFDENLRTVPKGEPYPYMLKER